MLSIRIKDDNEGVLTDIEEEFTKLEFRGTALNSIFLKEIEQGKYKDSTHFIDRFGDKLSTNFMSTGCKAAVIVAESHDKEIDITEAGLNARDCIIRHVKNGKIAIVYPGATISYDEDEPGYDTIDVGLNGYRFLSLERLNLYLK